MDARIASIFRGVSQIWGVSVYKMTLCARHFSTLVFFDHFFNQEGMKSQRMQGGFIGASIGRKFTMFSISSPWYFIFISTEYQCQASTQVGRAQPTTSHIPRPEWQNRRLSASRSEILATRPVRVFRAHCSRWISRPLDWNVAKETNFVNVTHITEIFSHHVFDPSCHFLCLRHKKCPQIWETPLKIETIRVSTGEIPPRRRSIAHNFERGGSN
jgi:hypothetical protein